MSIEASRITRVLDPGAVPTAPQVQRFLTTTTNEVREGRPPVILTGTHAALNDDLLEAHSVLTRRPDGQELGAEVNAPQWLREAAADPRKVHRVARFQLEGGHSLWFVETTAYRAGWFVNSMATPLFVSEPGTFRPSPPGEDIFADRF
jgi:hypothetical protein